MNEEKTEYELGFAEGYREAVMAIMLSLASGLKEMNEGRPGRTQVRTLRRL